MAGKQSSSSKKTPQLSEFTVFICPSFILKHGQRDFPGGAVVKNPPANAGDTGSIPGPGRPHMLQSN